MNELDLSDIWVPCSFTELSVAFWGELEGGNVVAMVCERSRRDGDLNAAATGVDR